MKIGTIERMNGKCDCGARYSALATLVWVDDKVAWDVGGRVHRFPITGGGRNHGAAQV